MSAVLSALTSSGGGIGGDNVVAPRGVSGRQEKGRVLSSFLEDGAAARVQLVAEHVALQEEEGTADAARKVRRGTGDSQGGDSCGVALLLLLVVLVLVLVLVSPLKPKFIHVGRIYEPFASVVAGASWR
jgi:hypothetical protein